MDRKSLFRKSTDEGAKESASSLNPFQNKSGNMRKNKSHKTSTRPNKKEGG